MYSSKNKAPCLNNYFENTKYAKNSSCNIRKLLQEAENDNNKWSTSENGGKPKTDLHLVDKTHDMGLQISSSLKEHKIQSFLEEKRRQQLRENTEELKELEMKLRTAYISKGLAAQILERELLKKKEKEEQNFENELVKKAKIEEEENERHRTELDRHKKVRLLAELKKQIEQNEHKKTLKIEEYVEEKKACDNISQKIWNEQHEEKKSKHEKRTKLQKDAEEFFRARKMLEAVKHSTDIEENKKIEGLQKEKDERVKKEKENKLMKLLERQQISENMGNKLNIIEREKRKRIDVLEDLLIEEKAAHDEEVEQKENSENIKKQIRYRKGLFDLIEDNKRRAEEQVKQDNLCRIILMEELAKKDKLDKVKEEQKKQKMLQYKKDFLEDLDFKVQLRTAELTELLNQRENDIRESQRKQQLIEEERIKMLQEHAGALQGFIPPNVLKKSDNEFLPLSLDENMK